LEKSEKLKKYYLCGGEIIPPVLKLRRIKGEMAERSNAAVLKTVILYPRNRGFESLFLRQRPQISPAALSCGIFVLLKSRTRLA
jgi:hypothetical protein